MNTIFRDNQDTASAGSAIQTAVRSLHGTSKKGFSLIELLTVISVISVISSFAVPQISSLKSAAGTAVQQRNAQNIVSVFRAGKDAALIKWVNTSRNACVADVLAGRAAPSNSIFAGQMFRVPNIKGPDLTAVYRFIGIDSNKNLFFDKSGGQPAS
jgi:prepilin-type N-terminal cleavage/methylation domain-containing protein